MKRLEMYLVLAMFVLLPVLRIGAQTAGVTPSPEYGAKNRLIAAAQRNDRDRPDQDHRDFRNDLRITRALYGTGKHIVDVTAQLNSQIRQGRLSIPVNNDTMGGDPYPNRVKTLQVAYTVDGRSNRVTLNEGDYLQLPRDGGDNRSSRDPDSRSRDSRDDHR